MDIPIGNFVASGGVSAAVVIIFYMTYKACERKRFKSQCCGGVIEVKADVPSPSVDQKPTLTIRETEKEPPV